MMALAGLTREGFAIVPCQVGDEVHVAFGGSADKEAEPLLPGYFRLLHTEVLRLGVGLVVVDIRELYFINSSCLKSIVMWIDLLNGTSSVERYRIRFVKDPKLQWQTRSFDALHRMCIEYVSVEDWSGGAL